MKSQKESLEYIYSVQKELSYLGSAMSLMGWDERINMPQEAVQERAEASAYFSGMSFEKYTAKKFYSTICELKKSELDKKDTIVVERLYKDITKIKNIPKSFVEELSKVSTMSQSGWEQAREKNDFNVFKPHLEKLIKLKRQQAEYLDKSVSHYDALLDEFEEGMTSDKLTKTFDYLKPELLSIIKKVKSKKHKHTDIPVDKQKLISKDIMKRMGLSDKNSRLDVSAHPFTTKITRSDVRITTRYLDPFESFLATVHEAGHALYELGLPKKYKNTTIYGAPSLGIHESQSRFWENMVARSKSFWDSYTKIFNDISKTKNIPQELYEAVNQIQPSLIRVNSDEVHYCLHIIQRFEIERDLMNGNLSINQAKKQWDTMSTEFFGKKPKDDNEGILQDVHWSMGAFGYFPTYALGTIYAAQIYNTIAKKIDIKKEIKSLNFKNILEFLRKNVHEKGHTMQTEEIIKKFTGSGLNPQDYISYLKNKYNS